MPRVVRRQAVGGLRADPGQAMCVGLAAASLRHSIGFHVGGIAFSRIQTISSLGIPSNPNFMSMAC